MNTVRWVFGGVLMAFWFYCAAFNAAIIIRWAISRKQASSIPFIGGLSGALALFIIPVRLSMYWFWVPLIVDIGCIPLAVRAFAYSVSHRDVK